MKKWALYLAVTLTAISITAPMRKVFAAEEVKIGYVDLQAAMDTIEEVKRQRDQLKKDFENKQKKLNDMQNDLKKEKDDFDKKNDAMKQEIRAKKMGEMQAKMMKLQETYVNMQKEIGQKEEELTQAFYGKVKNIVDKIGDKEGYTVILNRNVNTVIYFKRHMDITDQVVKAYNSVYK